MNDNEPIDILQIATIECARTLEKVLSFPPGLKSAFGTVYKGLVERHRNAQSDWLAASYLSNELEKEASNMPELTRLLE